MVSFIAYLYAYTVRGLDDTPVTVADKLQATKILRGAKNMDRGEASAGLPGTTPDVEAGGGPAGERTHSEQRKKLPLTTQATISQAQRSPSLQMKHSPTGQQCDSEKT